MNADPPVDHLNLQNTNICRLYEKMQVLLSVAHAFQDQDVCMQMFIYAETSMCRLFFELEYEMQYSDLSSGYAEVGFFMRRNMQF
jgi:hypothetical protein